MKKEKETLKITEKQWFLFIVFLSSMCVWKSLDTTKCISQLGAEYTTDRMCIIIQISKYKLS